MILARRGSARRNSVPRRVGPNELQPAAVRLGDPAADRQSEACTARFARRPSRERALSARKNRSKMCDCASAGMPGPSSVTVMWYSCARRVSASVTVPPRGECLIALSSRLSSTRPSRSASPLNGESSSGRSSIRTLAFLRERADGARGVVDDVLQVQRLATKRQMTGVGAREQEQVVDDAAESPRRIAHDGDRVAIFGFRSVCSRERDVCFGAQHGDRRAQLVRRVGHESPLLRERALESLEQAVDDVGERAQLVASFADGQALVEVRSS